MFVDVRGRSGRQSARGRPPPAARRGGPESTRRGDGEHRREGAGRRAGRRRSGRRSGPSRARAEGPSYDTPPTRPRGVRRRSETALRRRTTGPRMPPAGTGARLTALSGPDEPGPRGSVQLLLPAAPLSPRGLPGSARCPTAAEGCSGHPRVGGPRAGPGRCRADDGGSGRRRPVRASAPGIRGMRREGRGSSPLRSPSGAAGRDLRVGVPCGARPAAGNGGSRGVRACPGPPERWRPGRHPDARPTTGHPGRPASGILPSRTRRPGLPQRVGCPGCPPGSGPAPPRACAARAGQCVTAARYPSGSSSRWSSPATSRTRTV